MLYFLFISTKLNQSRSKKKSSANMPIDLALIHINCPLKNGPHGVHAQKKIPTGSLTLAAQNRFPSLLHQIHIHACRWQDIWRPRHEAHTAHIAKMTQNQRKTWKTLTPLKKLGGSDTKKKSNSLIPQKNRGSEGFFFPEINGVKESLQPLHASQRVCIACSGLAQWVWTPGTNLTFVCVCIYIYQYI